MTLQSSVSRLRRQLTRLRHTPTPSRLPPALAGTILGCAAVLLASTRASARVQLATCEPQAAAQARATAAVQPRRGRRDLSQEPPGEVSADTGARAQEGPCLASLASHFCCGSGAACVAVGLVFSASASAGGCR